MNFASPFVTIEKNGQDTRAWTVHQLETAGLRVIRTFDLQEARLVQSDCPCPHHGTAECNCQMSILLVYQGEQPPASLLIHSFQETTWLSLLDSPGHPVAQDLVLLIRELLTRPVPVQVGSEK